MTYDTVVVGSHVVLPTGIIEKALECRKSDIEKAETTSDEYFLKLVENLDESKKDLPQIENALKKIKLYSE